MKRSALMLLPALCLSLGLAACVEKPRAYTSDIKLAKPLEFRPRRLPTGDPTDHPCIRGGYTHVFDTDDGQYGQREVWLCCVPVEAILSGSFNCGVSDFPTPSIERLLGGSSGYWKIRYCSVLHPTEPEPTFIPACIPAPVQAQPY